MVISHGLIAREAVTEALALEDLPAALEHHPGRGFGTVSVSVTVPSAAVLSATADGTPTSQWKYTGDALSKAMPSTVVVVRPSRRSVLHF